MEKFEGRKQTEKRKRKEKRERGMTGKKGRAEERLRDTVLMSERHLVQIGVRCWRESGRR